MYIVYVSLVLLKDKTIKFNIVLQNCEELKGKKEKGNGGKGSILHLHSRQIVSDIFNLTLPGYEEQ